MRCIYVLVTFVAVMGLVVPGSADAVPAHTSYVALGDSYASGAGIPPAVGDPRCTRSGDDYPSLTARALGVANFTDVTCTSAQLVNMAAPQPATGQPAQFDALKPDTDLVTVGMGLNDSNLFPVLSLCTAIGVFFPDGAPCTVLLNLFGFDYAAGLVTSEAPGIGAMLQGIHQRSPRAKVLVVGLPSFLPEVPTQCRPQAIFSTGDMPYLSGLIRTMNEVLRDQAQRNGASYVDVYSSSVGHDMCQPDDRKWAEGLFPTHPAAVSHPNLFGMENESAQVVAALGVS
jgi:hypothetical protein